MTYHLFSDRRTKARKRHACIWCCCAILPGSVYVREHSVYDGGFQNFAWHEACHADATEWFAEAGGETEFISGHEMPFHALYQLEAAA